VRIADRQCDRNGCQRPGRIRLWIIEQPDNKTTLCSRHFEPLRPLGAGRNVKPKTPEDRARAKKHNRNRYVPWAVSALTDTYIKKKGPNTW
jgi:hypothetical protein